MQTALSSTSEIAALKRAPIFIMSLNRPYYLARVLESLVSQEDAHLDDRIIALFQDGAVNPFSNKRHAEDDQIEACIDLFRRVLPKGRIMASPTNLGVALNFDRAERFGFEELNEDVIIFLEDDLVLSPYYLSVLQTLINNYADDERVGYVAAYGDHTKSLEQQRANRRALIALEHNWGFALYRRQWLRMRKYVLEYLDIVKHVDYTEKDGNCIRELFASWGFGCPAISQDAAKTIACCMHNVIKINTFVCYGTYIGEHGLHMNAQIFKERGYYGTAMFQERVDRFDPLTPDRYAKILTTQLDWAGRPSARNDAKQTDAGSHTSNPDTSLAVEKTNMAVSPSMIQFVPISTRPDAFALFQAAKAAQRQNDFDNASKLFAQGMTDFPEVVDDYKHPAFAKEAIRLSLSQNDVEIALAMRHRLVERYGSFDWDTMLFARHYSTVGDAENAIQTWRSVLALGPNTEASAELARLEVRAAGDQRLTKYLGDGLFKTVAGTCVEDTLHQIRQFNDFQIENGINGDLIEIGVYHGRLFIMLALIARPKEGALAIDVFDADTNYDPSGGTTTLQIVRKNFSSFVGESSDFHYIASDSLRLTGEMVVRQLPSGCARMVSIDGAHSHFHTAHDLGLAESVLAPGGLVAVDDITNSQWPGVMEGVARYFLYGSGRRLFPFMMSLNKLWLTTYDFHKRYLDFAASQLPLTRPGQHKRITNFFGSELVGW